MLSKKLPSTIMPEMALQEQQCSLYLAVTPSSPPLYYVRKRTTVKHHVAGTVKRTFRSAYTLAATASSSGMGGWILSNGEVRKKQRSSSGTCPFRKESAYIMQDDQLWPLFTVLEIMNMSANLKLGFSLSAKAKHLVWSVAREADLVKTVPVICSRPLGPYLINHTHALLCMPRYMTNECSTEGRDQFTDDVSQIDDILDTLGLNETKTVSCKDLSGGQKKRLSIALEMVDNPPVMFLDEPTTFKLRVRHTILSTSPTFKVRVRHAIPPTIPTFKVRVRVLEIASGEYGHFIQELAAATTSKCWRKHDELTETVSEEQITGDNEKTDSTKTMILIDTPSEYTKFWVLLYRCFVLLYRDWTVTHLKCVFHILVGVLLGLNYLNIGSDGSKTINNLGYMVVTITYLTFTSMMPAALRFPSELAVLKKERFNNWYYLRTYYLAFLVSNCPIQLASVLVVLSSTAEDGETEVRISMLYCVLHTSVSYLLTAQPLNIERFAMFMLACLLVTLIGESIGLLLGTLCNPVNGTFFGSIYICFMLLFSGFLILFNHMTNYMYWMSYLSAFRYTTMGMILAMYDYGRDGLPCPEDTIYCHLRSPSLVIREFGTTAGYYWVNIGALVGLLILFRVITFFTLRRCIKSC
uniref:ABC transporter domain-containing protein n=1 Tax=Timema cristinae TaxID=61476 RepID=A0A7R9GSW4_TIMCR|nr:unnamed protein product [Timema cristinae]